MMVRVEQQDFDPGFEIEQLRSAKAGAIVSFLGVVRDFAQDSGIIAMELEHYPAMTAKALQQIVEDAKERWDVEEILVIHRIGKLLPMDRIVLVAVSCAHRKDAFAACEYVIDRLKTAAPFWKKETSAQGERWVEARESDENAAARWGI